MYVQYLDWDKATPTQEGPSLCKGYLLTISNPWFKLYWYLPWKGGIIPYGLEAIFTIDIKYNKSNEGILWTLKKNHRLMQLGKRGKVHYTVLDNFRHNVYCIWCAN